jgi:hypothetical protein
MRCRKIMLARGDVAADACHRGLQVVRWIGSGAQLAIRRAARGIGRRLARKGRVGLGDVAGFPHRRRHRLLVGLHPESRSRGRTRGGVLGFSSASSF